MVRAKQEMCRYRYPYTGKPCRYKAKFLVIAPWAPPAVCGVHARAYLHEALIPLTRIWDNVDIDMLPKINTFLEEVKRAGIQVGRIGISIMISFGPEGGSNEQQEKQRPGRIDNQGPAEGSRR